MYTAWSIWLMFVVFRSLVQAVSMIQNNARDLGELQKKVDSWHNMGLDEREIAIRSKDEQLRSKTHSIFSLNLIPWRGKTDDQDLCLCLYPLFGVISSIVLPVTSL